MNNLQKKSKKLLLIGGSGFIGSKIGEALSKKGWKIKLLTRKKEAYDSSFPCDVFQWDGLSVPTSAMEDLTAIINLAGESVAEGSWNSKQKQKIFDSRINTTRAMVNAIKNSSKKPELVIQASAIGYYGMSSQSKDYDESSSSGNDFLANVCKKWEAELDPIKKQCRLCIARIGLVLGWEGGALPKLWDIYTSGLGSILSNGNQWMNWIHIEDVVTFFIKSLEEESYSGTYNLVAPKNIRNKDFHTLLCKYTPSWSKLKAPSFAVSTLLGKKADLVLKGPNVIPKNLLDQNFNFKFKDLDSCMKDLVSERIHLKAHYLKVKQWIPTELDLVWDFVSKAQNLEKITPDFLNFKIKNSSTPSINKGTLINYSLKLHGFPISWQSKISEWKPKSLFIDEQIKGPYKLWHHRHLFQELEGGTLIEDRVEYRLPVYPFGQVALAFVNNDLKKIFDYRKNMTQNFLVSQA